MVEILLLTRNETAQVLKMKDAIDAVEDAYRAHGNKKAINPFAISFVVPKYNGEVDVKPAYIEDIECSGVKFAGGYWDNPTKYNLPSVISVIILADGKNGLPLAIMDGTHVGSYRTGAAGGVGAKYLARKDSEKVAMLGTGNQGRMQFKALSEVFKIKKVKSWDLNESRNRTYAKEISELYGVDVVPTLSVKEAVRDADIIVTATPATNAILYDDWISPGTHINAIGADMPGKQELDPEIFRRAKTVVDYLPQCIKIGEVQTAVKLGILSESTIYAEIGEIVAGKKKGRTNDEEITVFDSTGLGIQDVSAAHKTYSLAKKQKIGKMVEFF